LNGFLVRDAKQSHISVRDFQLGMPDKVIFQLGISMDYQFVY
jgi:hypothetical protein